VNFERIVLTTFPGYFYSQIKCLRSIQQYAAGFPIDIIIDDFGLQNWPTYVDDCQQHITAHFPDTDITFHKFSNFSGMGRVRTGGWFRQQLVKLYLDQFVSGDSWLLVDADVEFAEPVRVDKINASVHYTPDPINVGNRLYVSCMLDTDKPWVINENEFWCLSSVPFRYIERDLLVQLRSHVESIHNKSLFDYHLELFDEHKLVAFDPESKLMIMSEFQLIEIFRHRYYHSPMPIVKNGASFFNHSSIKDWNIDRTQFEEHVTVDNNYWARLQNFGKYHV